VKAYWYATITIRNADGTEISKSFSKGTNDIREIIMFAERMEKME
jgi:hypothetical protein